VDSLRESLKDNPKDYCGTVWRIVEESLWSVLTTFVVTLWSFPTISEVIVIVNKTSLLVELDDCYCCAC